MFYKLVIILTIGLFAFGGHAKADSRKLIRYEDFIMFNKEQKIEAIKQVHKFLEKYEDLSILERAKKRNKRKYQTYMKILDFVLSSAYAQDKDMMNNLFDLDESTKGTICYYAGWLSFSYGGYCSHPKNLQALLDKANKGDKSIMPTAEQKKFYANIIENYNKSKTQKVMKLSYVPNGNGGGSFELVESKGCNGTDDIMCNPKMYGDYKGAPFCVPGNNQRGLNSSFMCSHAAKTVNEKFGQDAYDELMLKIAQTAVDKGTSGEFFYTLASMYDTCLCAGDKPKDAGAQRVFAEHINYKYANRIFYSRTCYGIINQTQNIYNALADTDSFRCEALNVRVNPGAGEASYPWDEYLAKINAHIEKQEIQKKIDAHVTLLQMDENDVDYDKYKSAFDVDDKNFRPDRQKHFEQNLAENLCPVGEDLRDPNDRDDDNKEPSLTAECKENCTGKENPDALIETILTLGDQEVDKDKIKFYAEIGEDKKDPGSVDGYKANFTITRGEEPITVNFYADVDGKKVGPTELILKPLKDDDDDKDGPQLEIAVEKAEGDKEKTHSIVKLSVKLPAGEITKENPEGIQKAEVKHIEGLVLKGPDGKEYSGKVPEGETFKRFEVERKPEGFDVEGSGKYGDVALTPKKATIPGTKEDGQQEESPEKKDCSAELAFEQGDKGDELELLYTFDGEEYPKDGKDAPEGVSAEVQWYDSVLKAEEVAKEEPVKETLDQVNTGDEDDKEEEETAEEKKEDTRSEEVADIEDKLNKVNEPTVTRGPAARTVAVVLTFTQDGKQVCQTSAQTEVPAGDPPKVKNDNYATQNRGQGRATGRGKAYGGQR